MQGILIFKRTKTNHSSSKRMDEKSTPVESYNYDNLNFFFADWVLAEKKKKKKILIFRLLLLLLLRPNACSTKKKLVALDRGTKSS